MTATRSTAAADEAVLELAAPPSAASVERRAPTDRRATGPATATESSREPTRSQGLATAATPALVDPALLLPHLDSPQALHLAEAANLARPVLKYLATTPNHRLVPFDRAWLAMLHQEMFGDVWAWAGRVRETPIEGATPAQEIDAALDAMLTARTKAIANSLPPIERSAALLAHAWSIRPFLHGNGRWARLLVDIDLALFREPTIGWPNDPAARPILREALAASRRGDLGTVTTLLRRWQRG